VLDVETSTAERTDRGNHSVAGGPGAFRRIRLRAGLPAAHSVTDFIRELATLLSVGLPLHEALTVVARQHGGAFHATVLVLRERVASGSALADAMRAHPRAFDDLCVNITDVGENSGTLDASLFRLADFRERSQQLKGRVGTALIYPAIVLVTAAFASVFLMTFVVPRVLEPILEQGQELPLPTRVVRAVSEFLVSWWWLLALAAASVFGLLVAAMRRERWRRRWHQAILRIPLLGDLVRKQEVVRIAIVMSTLLKSGTVFLAAVGIAQRTTRNLVIRDALGRCAKAVSAGGDIGEALEQTQAFPPTVVQVFALGQQSGKLETMLDRLAATYDQQVSAAAQRLTAILEPVLILLLAGLVLFIVLATVLPILEAGNVIH
jgi:type II secretory pathway component PulF